RAARPGGGGGGGGAPHGGKVSLPPRTKPGRLESDPARPPPAAGCGGRSQCYRKIEPPQTSTWRSNRGRKSPDCAPDCAESADRKNGESVARSMAGAGGLEPPNGGIKIRCLTTWLRPIRRLSKPARRADHIGRNVGKPTLAAAPRSAG